MDARDVRTRRSYAVAAGALAALMLVTGCGEGPPAGAASTVNGEVISRSQVDELARAQCVAADNASEQGQAQAAPLSRVQALSLGLLIDIELTEQYGRELDLTVDKSVAKGIFDQFKPGIDPLPEQAREELTDVLGTWADGRALLIEAGSQTTGQAITLENFQQLLDAGVKTRDAWSKNAEITTDARYGPNADGFPGGENSSVSRAVSSFAKQGAKPEPEASWAGGLPANQKCG